MLNCNTCKKLIPDDSEFCPFCGNKIIRNVSEKIEQVNQMQMYPTDALIKRAFLFIEESLFDKANIYIEEVLNRDPENAEAYLAKLLMDYNVADIDELSRVTEPFDNNLNYKRAYRYGDEILKKSLENARDEKALSIARQEEERHILQENAKEISYQEAKSIINATKTSNIIKLDKDLHSSLIFLSKNKDYKDSEELYNSCAQKLYKTACSKSQSHVVADLETAVKIFKAISEYEDSKEQMQICTAKLESLSDTPAFTFTIIVASLFFILIGLVLAISLS